MESLNNSIGKAIAKCMYWFATVCMQLWGGWKEAGREAAAASGCGGNGYQRDVPISRVKYMQ
jgi:hypothetical protein